MLGRITAFERQQAAESNRRLKIRKIKLFLEESETLNQFLTQLRLYFTNNTTQLSTKINKVLAASSFLIKNTINWFVLYVND